MKTYNIICASYFDPLGHPLFADKVCENIIKLEEDNVRVRIYGILSDEKESPNNVNIIGVKVPFFGKYYSNKSRKRLIEKFHILGKIIFYAIRMAAILGFYLIVYRKISPESINIDLEFEPIQEFFASIPSTINKKRHIFVIHNFPRPDNENPNPIYKKISLIFFRIKFHRNSNCKMALMNDLSLKDAIDAGFNHNNLILAGWGYDYLPEEKENVSVDPNDRVVKMLSFGIIRRDKRIKELVELFIELDQKYFSLNITGKSQDVDTEELKTIISDSDTKTKIAINDHFLEEDEIPELIRQHDIMVISHEEWFTSMSGPLLLAIQYNKPILCFSSHSIAEIVKKTNSGFVMDINSKNYEEIIARIFDLKDLEYDSSMLESYQWYSITKRLISWES